VQAEGLRQALSQAFGLIGLFVRADPRALPRAKLSQAFGLKTIHDKLVCNDKVPDQA
jgi:hypothetical protein